MALSKGHKPASCHCSLTVTAPGWLFLTTNTVWMRPLSVRSLAPTSRRVSYEYRQGREAGLSGLVGLGALLQQQIGTGKTCSGTLWSRTFSWLQESSGRVSHCSASLANRIPGCCKGRSNLLSNLKSRRNNVVL